MIEAAHLNLSFGNPDLDFLLVEADGREKIRALEYGQDGKEESAIP